MTFKSTALAAVALAATVVTAQAQDKIELIYSDTVQESDIRTTTLREVFGACLGDEFDFKSYHGATLFKQGTELTAMQRGNLDMGNLAIFDFYNQVPHTKVLGVPFMYRDYDHLRAVWSSGRGFWVTKALSNSEWITTDRSSRRPCPASFFPSRASRCG